jgi:hypothetical protein
MNKPPDGGLFQGMIETRRSLWRGRIIDCSDERGLDHEAALTGVFVQVQDGWSATAPEQLYAAVARAACSPGAEAAAPRLLPSKARGS